MSDEIPQNQPQQVMMGIPTSPTPQATSSSTSSIMALILGILSLTCCGFFAGIPAFFVGRAEIKNIDEGRSPETNRSMAKIGMILGLVGAAFSCLGTLAYLAIIALGITGGMMHDKFPF